MSERIQRRRTKGWRMPEGAVYVGRPSRWGNPYKVPAVASFDVAWYTRLAVTHYRAHLQNILWDDPSFLAPLRGHDLACWCPLDQPCHADVLLELVS